MTQTTTTTYETVKQILLEKFRVPEAEIDLERTLREHDLDSLDVVELASMLEDRLGVEISDDDLTDAGTLGAVIDLVSARADAAA